MSIGAMLTTAGIMLERGTSVLHAERTFFGVYRVSEDRKGEYRALAHGTTLHGMQALHGPEKGEPLTYFHRSGPFGQAFAGTLTGAAAATRRRDRPWRRHAGRLRAARATVDVL